MIDRDVIARKLATLEDLRTEIRARSPTSLEELETDREQQEDDADLGEGFYGVGAGDEPERVRPDRDAGEEKPDDGRNAQALRDDDDRDGDGDEDDEVAEDWDFMHDEKLRREAGSGRREAG